MKTRENDSDITAKTSVDRTPARAAVAGLEMP
jgi:hypothetical protein